MAKKTTFENGYRTFRFADDGDLMLRPADYEGEQTAIEAGEVEAFAAWLNEEVARLRAEKTDGR